MLIGKKDTLRRTLKTPLPGENNTVNQLMGIVRFLLALRVSVDGVAVKEVSGEGVCDEYGRRVRESERG